MTRKARLKPHGTPAEPRAEASRRNSIDPLRGQQESDWKPARKPGGKQHRSVARGAWIEDRIEDWMPGRSRISRRQERRQEGRQEAFRQEGCRKAAGRPQEGRRKAVGRT